MRTHTSMLLALLSWAMLVTPWQRCQSECQDAVVGAWDHACHQPVAHPDCHDNEEHPDQPCDDDGGCEDEVGEHESLTFTLTRPNPAEDSFPDGDDVATGGTPARLVATAHVSASRTAAVPRSPPHLALVRSVVLLL